MEVNMEHKISFAQYTKQINILSKYNDETALFNCKHCNKRFRISKKCFMLAKIMDYCYCLYVPIVSIILLAIFNINKYQYGTLLYILISLIGYLCLVGMEYVFFLYTNRKLIEVDSDK